MKAKNAIKKLLAKIVYGLAFLHLINFPYQNIISNLNLKPKKPNRSPKYYHQIT